MIRASLRRPSPGPFLQYRRMAIQRSEAAALVAWAVLAYFCVDFGYWSKLFPVDAEHVAQPFVWGGSCGGAYWITSTPAAATITGSARTFTKW